ncbi:hypothetical protein DUZ96_09265 [Winogradskyella sp. KYW1333]|nr:hypothetical protein DUZ96_09265 [Winogradskyella sp. KYW1333]
MDYPLIFDFDDRFIKNNYIISLINCRGITITINYKLHFFKILKRMGVIAVVLFFVFSGYNLDQVNQ